MHITNQLPAAAAGYRQPASQAMRQENEANSGTGGEKNASHAGNGAFSGTSGKRIVSHAEIGVNSGAGGAKTTSHAEKVAISGKGHLSVPKGPHANRPPSHLEGHSVCQLRLKMGTLRTPIGHRGHSRPFSCAKLSEKSPELCQISPVMPKTG